MWQKHWGMSKQISIHTPAKGVTWLDGFEVFPFNISIHTPAKGVTIFCKWDQQGKDYFNPHSREGSDNYNPSAGVEQWNFNPHSREGSDTEVLSSF